MEGTLTPNGDIADTAEVIESVTLGDANVPRPDVTAMNIAAATNASSSGVSVAHNQGSGTIVEVLRINIALRLSTPLVKKAYRAMPSR